MPTDPAAFLKRLETSGLLTDSIAAAWPQLARVQSAEDAAGELISQSLLTDFQADVLLTGESIPLVIGDYIVRDMIGQGGMGLVLKARHQRMRRTVAIKFLLKSMAPSKSIEKRFEREVEAAAKLDHPNIVTAYDAGVHEDGSYYLVMQYVEGQNLSALVKDRGPLPVPLAVHAITQAAEGLAYAHDRGIIHRDVKPGNLLLDHEGVVRVLDMGLARIRSTPGEAVEDGGHADLTSTGSVMGTVDFMAPEQALDARMADNRADIYGLGCTLYYLLTGNAPFLRDTIMRRLLAHREDEIPSIRVVRPETPRELDDIFQRMLAKKPEHRQASMQQLLADLNRLNIAGASQDVMETLEQPTSDPDPSSVVFASADEDSADGSSGRSSESPQPGVAMKPRPVSRHRAQPQPAHPVTEEFFTFDTDQLEKQLGKEPPAAKSPPGEKSRRKRGKRKRPAKRKAEPSPVLRRTRSHEAAAPPPLPKPRLQTLLAWIFVSSWGVPRIYFVGLAAIAFVILLISFGPDSTDTPIPDDGTVAQDTPPVDGPRRNSIGDGDFALKFGTDATRLIEVNSIKLHSGSPLTLEARITPETLPGGTRATVLQLPGVARLFIHSNGGTWSLGCALVNAAGTSVESLSNVEHVFETDHHIAAVWNLTTLKTYVDGKDESAWKFLPNPLKAHTQPARIGIDIDGRTQFSGLIDEIRISNAIRYTEGFTVPAQHKSDDYTVALYHFDDGIGDKLTDSSDNRSNAAVSGAAWVLVRDRLPIAKPDNSGDLAMQPVRELNSSATDGYCWLSLDGLTIYFTREGIAKSGVWKSKRITPSNAFAMPTFATRVRQIALSGDESIAIALMGYDKPAELAECNRRFFRQAPLDSFKPIPAFSQSQSAKSPWLSRDGLTLLFQRTDKSNNYAGGPSPLSSRTEFVVSTRAGHDLPWSQPRRLRLERAPSLRKPLTWPMTTDDGLTLFFCHGASTTSDVMIATRRNQNEEFSNVRQIFINDEPLQGRAPRYFESTRELFVTRLHEDSDTDWDLFVIREFDIASYR